MANIKDFKIGDIMTVTAKRSDEKYVLIYNGIDEEYCNSILSFCHVFNNRFFCPTKTSLKSADHCFVDRPTVAEVQMLYQKIHDAGYRWDEEKRELITLKHRAIDLVEESRIVKDKADGMEWVSIEEKLPADRVNVWVLGIDEQFGRKVRQTWVTKRKKPDEYTDGYGFIKHSGYGHIRITHWFPIPKLNGFEVFPTLPE